MYILSHLYILLRLFGSSFGASSDFKYLTFVTTVILTIFFFIDILLQYLMHRGMFKFWPKHDILLILTEVQNHDDGGHLHNAVAEVFYTGSQSGAYFVEFC